MIGQEVSETSQGQYEELSSTSKIGIGSDAEQKASEEEVLKVSDL